jgi:hypothetical protein
VSVDWTLDPTARAVARVCLALLFATALLHKLRDRGAFRAAIADYRLLPGPVLAVAAPGLLVCEAGIAIGLWVPGGGALPALAAAALLALYAAAIAANLARGRRHIDCGCFGPAAGRALHGGLVARNAVLAAIALAAALPAAPRPWIWLDALTGVAAVATGVALYVAADTALANAPRLRELRTP